MSQVQTMFVRNITQIDFAYIDDAGKVVGDSVNFNADVTGSVDGQEQVVIDFSACKKQIKYIIDDTDLGIDHKLVVFKNWSDAEYSEGTRHLVTTPVVRVSAESKNVTVVPWAGSVDASIMAYMDSMLGRELSVLHGRDITIVSDLNRILAVSPKIKTIHTFHYAHGLKNSSSYGCQNIAHGHFSYIGVDVESPEADQLVFEMAKSFDRALLINKHDFADSVLKYDGMTRGKFDMNISEYHRVIEMETDTTVENIVNFVYNEYKDSLKAIGATQLWVSEGLSKGAVVEV